MSQQPPFISVEGVHNFRDISSHPHNLALRPGFIFRSTQPYNATNAGIERMKALVRLTPLRDIVGLKRVSVPVFENREANVAEKLLIYSSNDTQAIITTSSKILADGANCFREIFCHIRDKPGEPCLIHCALGKDRTGVAVALILRLAGFSKDEITEEYALSTIGLEAYKPAIRVMLAAFSQAVWNESKIAAMLSVRSETMLALLDMLDSQYGGAESYLRNEGRFDDLEIALIKFNLRNEPGKQVLSNANHGFVRSLVRLKG